LPVCGGSARRRYAGSPTMTVGNTAPGNTRDVQAHLPRLDRHKPKCGPVRPSKMGRRRMWVLIGVHVLDRSAHRLVARRGLGDHAGRAVGSDADDRDGPHQRGFPAVPRADREHAGLRAAGSAAGRATSLRCRTRARGCSESSASGRAPCARVCSCSPRGSSRSTCSRGRRQVVVARLAVRRELARRAARVCSRRCPSGTGT
jgi:hypothetical protein